MVCDKERDGQRAVVPRWLRGNEIVRKHTYAMGVPRKDNPAKMGQLVRSMISVRQSVGETDR